jgi:aspartyl aminopeptidase
MKRSESLGKQLKYRRKNFWQIATKKEQRVAIRFSDKYKDFLDRGKTVREVISVVEKALVQKDFSEISKARGDKSVYAVSRGKTIAFAKIGKRPIQEGLNIVVAHVDSPRIDLKQFPLFQDEKTSLGLLKTHYYGGIKKYQWLSTPLALHGVLIRNDGRVVNVSIGESDDEPVFVMPDLCPHLSKRVQNDKRVTEVIDASHMNVIFNSIPFTEKDKEVRDAVKLNALIMLNQKYGITEEDFLSAELELVPAGKARDLGLDSSMVMAYGQDDRICVYSAMTALFDADDIDRTALVLLVDKEEIGSQGNTGATSVFFQDFVGELLKYNHESYDSYNLRKTLINTQILSGDVNAAFNPNFPTVHERDNAVHLGCGVSITKFTGHGGKSGANDANAEYVSKIMDIFNQERVIWQIGELGKVDEGGGGTVARIFAEYGSEVLDCGPGLISMHSLCEVCSKADLYSTYRAYKAFFVKA